MRIELDRPRCEGHGLCEEAAPELMHLDDEAELVLDVADVEGAALERPRGRPDLPRRGAQTRLTWRTARVGSSWSGAASRG